MHIEFTVTGLKSTKRRRRAVVNERRPISPLVRSIVLAYQIEQAIKEGRARDCADVAKQTGLTRARVSQIMGLLRLPPAIIEKLLLADPSAGPPLTERQLRPLIANPATGKQLSDLVRRLSPEAL